MPVLHFSFDDVAYTLHDLCVNRYASAFDQPFLRDLRDIHRETGAVFTLFCFNRLGKLPEYDIASLPEDYQAELSAAAGWLRFGFHAQDDASRYAETPGILSSYQRCNAALRRFAGEGSIDSFLRLGFFSGNLESVLAIRDADPAVRGLYAADDTRLSYYLNPQQNDEVIRTGRYDDTVHGMTFIRSLPRVDNRTAEEIISAMERSPQRLVEVFMHEYVYLSEPESCRARLAAIARWAGEQGYAHRFHADEVMG